MKVPLALLALIAACALRGAEPTGPSLPLQLEERIAALPKSAFAVNGFVEVVASDVPGDELGWRYPISRFAGEQVKKLERAFALKLPRRAKASVVIRAMNGTSNDVRVLVRRLRRADGSPATRLVLPAPGHTDLEQLRLEVTRATFHALGADFPDWLVQGAMRVAEPGGVDRDSRMTHELWRRGRLPFFPALCTDLRLAKGNAAALSGFIAGWMREKKLFAVWIDRLAAGGKWDGRRLAADLTGETEPVRQDAAADERQLLLMRRVFTPGYPTPSEVELFASRLLLFPPFFDKKLGNKSSFCTFSEALEKPGDDPVVAEVALRKARELPFHAVGRGAALQSAAEAYAQFLYAFASGKVERDDLRRRLDAADEKLEMAYEKSRKDGNR